MDFRYTRTIIALFVLFFVLLQPAPQAEEQAELQGEGGELEVVVATLLSPDAEARLLLEEQFNITVPIAGQMKKARSLCNSVPQKDADIKNCVSSILLVIVDKKYEDPNLELYESLSLYGQLVKGEPVFKRVLLSLLSQTDDGLQLAVLKSLAAFPLSTLERSIVQQSFNSPSEAITHAALKVFTNQNDLTNSEVFALTNPYSRGITAYSMVVEAFSSLNQSLYEEHIIYNAYKNDPLLRAWIAESIGKRAGDTYEEQVTQVLLYSTSLLKAIQPKDSYGYLELLAEYFEAYPSLETAYHFARRDKDPEKRAKVEVEKAIVLEELVATRAAYALFAIGTESALENARKALPLIESKLDTDPFIERMMLAELMCSLPEIPVDLRRESLVSIVREQYLEAETVLDCLAKYRDPELFPLFEQGLNSKLPTLEAASLTAIFDSWDALSLDMQNTVCKHPERDRMIESVKAQDLSRYCS
jgi:hypothetical protein